mmetsp:Transcript_46073/g.147368  ORF Transcript_46073/g.147368 Transcript_46073/m.147368 type:complete len:253 (+) Transcript_46073:3557-4315(+)
MSRAPCARASLSITTSSRSPWGAGGVARSSAMMPPLTGAPIPCSAGCSRPPAGRRSSLLRWHTAGRTFASSCTSTRATSITSPVISTRLSSSCPPTRTPSRTAFTTRRFPWTSATSSTARSTSGSQAVTRAPSTTSTPSSTRASATRWSIRRRRLPTSGRSRPSTFCWTSAPPAGTRTTICTSAGRTRRRTSSSRWRTSGTRSRRRPCRSTSSRARSRWTARLSTATIIRRSASGRSARASTTSSRATTFSR